MKAVLRPLELLFRHAIVYPLFRLVFRNNEVNTAIPLQSVRKLLILRYDRIGDIVVTTPVFRKLKRLHPGLILGVLASSSNADLVRTNPFVDRLHVLPKHWWQLPGLFREARRERYDVVLNFIFNRTTSGGVLANLIAPQAVKVGQGAKKYRFYFNRLLHLERGKDHMAEVLLKFTDTVFDLPALKRSPLFEIIVGDAERQSVASFMTDSALKTGKYIVLNISAAEKERQLSHQQSAYVAHVLSACGESVVVISAPADSGTRQSIVASTAGKIAQFPPRGNSDLLTIAALVAECKAVITPDTSVIHLASAMNVPVMGLYTPLRVTKEWLPYRVKHRIVLAPPDKPVSAIPLKTIETEVKLFLDSLKGKRPSGKRTSSAGSGGKRK